VFHLLPENEGSYPNAPGYLLPSARPPDVGIDVAGSDPGEGLWVCRGCASRQGVQFKYPSSPWVYCARSGCALTLEEQVVALARWQHERPPSPGASASGEGRPIEPAVAEREFLTIPAVAELLGRSVKGTYRLAAARALPGAIKVGGKWAVRRSELLRSAAEGRVSPGRSRR
jgi:predicted DNA-binding transcriptional regulator AlpA